MKFLCNNMKSWRIERKIRGEVKPKQLLAVEGLNGDAVEMPRNLAHDGSSDCQMVN